MSLRKGREAEGGFVSVLFKGKAWPLLERGSGWEAGQGPNLPIASGDPRSPVRASVGETAGRRGGGVHWRQQPEQQPEQ